MHRSRLVMLVTIAAVAACSTRRQSESEGSLSQDSTLVSHVREFKEADQQTDKQDFPAACGTFMIPAAAAANVAQARALAQRAYTAEMLANMREASALLERASHLDATDKSAAYHLGRVSEALGERHAAIQAYCRYLALSPSPAERAEALQRVLNLSQVQTASHPLVVAAAPRATRRPKHEAHSTSAVASGAVDLPAQPRRETTMTPPVIDQSVGSSVVDSEEVEVVHPLPSAVEQPPVERRGPNQVQSVGIGAIAGAILGGAAGRSAKSAAIGAVAGGILGAVAAHENRPPASLAKHGRYEPVADPNRM